MDALTLITPPELIVEIEDARNFLRITDEESNVLNDDMLIASLIETATAYVDGPEGLLGRSLGRQKWRLMLDGFPRDGIELPLPPLQSVDLIRYTTANGTTADLPSTAYRVAIPGAAPGVIRPRGLWPMVALGEATVEVQFTAGYDTVPAPIRTAILQHVALLYENRETAAYGSSSFQTVPFAGVALIEPYVRWSFGA